MGIVSDHGAESAEAFKVTEHVKGLKLRARATGELSNAQINLEGQLREATPYTVDGSGTGGTGTVTNPDDDDSVIGRITREDYVRYVADGTISGGMMPKIENALNAVDAGVKQVVITLATEIGRHSGTVISK